MKDSLVELIGNARHPGTHPTCPTHRIGVFTASPIVHLDLIMTNLAERAAFTVELARRVGREARDFRRLQNRAGLQVQSKGTQDFVTVADKNAEDDIFRSVAAAYPGDGFLGEETGYTAGESSSLWVVDPIDGTNNYLHGLPLWGVSIAFVQDNEIELGVIYDAMTDQVYWATRQGGAFCESERLQVTPRDNLDGAFTIVGTSRVAPVDGYVDLLRALHRAEIEHRRVGCAISGLTLVTSGIADGYFEARLNCWDAMAGILIAKEAGHHVFALDVPEFLAKPGPVIVGPPIYIDLIRKITGL
jgi:myo-inositol-1(or 4)-monophosphatase